jgi:hypothetical protein
MIFAIARVQFFPVTTSLPVLLTSDVMKHYSRGELANAIYYLMLIDDAAASTVLRVLKSRFLYDEIKAEAKIWLMSLTWMIANSGFYPMRCEARLAEGGRVPPTG